MRFELLAGAGLFFAGAAALGQAVPPSTASEAALAAIRKLGGEVKVDHLQPGAPVSVVLTGARQPAECLPLLADVANLRKCDL